MSLNLTAAGLADQKAWEAQAMRFHPMTAKQ